MLIIVPNIEKIKIKRKKKKKRKTVVKANEYLEAPKQIIGMTIIRDRVKGTFRLTRRVCK